MTQIEESSPYRSNRWPVFPNLTTIAYYSFTQQLITLNSIPIERAEQCLNGLDEARCEVLPLCAHEYTHWIDHVASLWGRRLLVAFYKGLNARLNENIDDYPNIVRANRWAQRATSARYFTTDGPKCNEPPPWNWGISVGVRFDRDGRPREDEPIMFVRFGVGDPFRNENLVSRVPVSAAALAECRAMTAEFAWLLNEHIVSQNTSTTNLSEWISHANNIIYDSKMLVYMTAFHLLANNFHVTGLPSVIDLANSLAWVSLNASKETLSGANIPERWISATNNRIAPFLAAQDPGFVYALLCSSIEEGAAIPTAGTAKRMWLNELVRRTFGVSLDEYFHAASVERATHLVEAQPLGDETLDTWLKAGDDWAEALGVDGDPAALVNCLNGSGDLPLPDVIAKDSGWNPRPTNRLQVPPFEDALEQHFNTTRWTKALDEFLEVCGQ